MQSYRSHEIIVHNHLIRDRVNESGEKVFGGKNDERISFILDGCFPFGFFNLYGISTQYKKQAAAFFLRLFFFSFELKKNHSLTFIWILTVKICPFAIYVYGIHRAYDIYFVNEKKTYNICCVLPGSFISYSITKFSYYVSNGSCSCIILKIV